MPHPAHVLATFALLLYPVPVIFAAPVPVVGVAVFTLSFADKYIAIATAFTPFARSKRVSLLVSRTLFLAVIRAVFFRIKGPVFFVVKRPFYFLGWRTFSNQ
jgi:hypothetical protein